MRERYNILFAAFVITFIIASIFSVYADSSNPSNLTNSSENSTYSTSKTNMASNAIIQPDALFISVTVTPSTIDLGNLAADGISNYYSEATTVVVEGAIGTRVKLFVNAGGNFKSVNGEIPLSNFRYSCYDADPVRSETQFSTQNTLIDNFYFDNVLYDSKTYHMNYFFTVPVGTNYGTYSTKITYTAK